MTPREHPVCVVVIVADGARPDTLSAAMADGTLPALARLRAEGSGHVVTSCFPSVTGPAYAPFLIGRHPAPLGLPGLRWYDRERRTCHAPSYARSYVGHQMRHVDHDLAPDAPTIFELAPSSLGALNVIGRGLRRRDRVGRGFGFALRTARTHFRGNVRGWLHIDRDVARTAARLIRGRRPRFSFLALTGIDKTSHAAGHRAPVVREAMRIVDETVAEIRVGAERAGRWGQTHIWIVSDHGHSPVEEHEDLAGLIGGWGHRVRAHPWTLAPRAEVAVMVSGNAMAHLYLDIEGRERPWWDALAPRWEALVSALLQRPSVDLVLLPCSPTHCEVRARGRGRAIVAWDEGRHDYLPLDGDPLGIGGQKGLDATAAWAATIGSDYPDALVQIAHLAGSARAGDVILSAARNWDFRARYEPIPHVSSHGALHREHMLVPLITSQPVTGTPHRTVDVMPSVLKLLGLPVPRGVEGEPFV